MEKIKSKTLSLSHFIDKTKKIKFIEKNKNELIKQQLYYKLSKENRLKDYNFELSKIEKIKQMNLLKKKETGIIGVKEGLIKLPEVAKYENCKFIKTKKEKTKYKLLNEDILSINSINSNDENQEISSLTKNEILKNNYIQLKIEQNEIKKLNNWDVQNTEAKKKESSNVLFYQEPSTLKWIIEIKNNQKQYEKLCKNKFLKDFFMRREEEQNIILNQNLNVNKKNFSLNVFDNNKNKNSSIQLSSVDYYRKVIREKISREELLRNDLILICENLNVQRNKKKDYLDQINDILYSISLISKKIENTKKLGEENVKKIQMQTAENLTHIDNIDSEKFNYHSQEKHKDKQNLRLNAKKDILSLAANASKEIERLKNEKKLLEVEISNIKEKIHDLDVEMRKVKMKIHNRVGAHKRYYFDILKQGIDVRSEGLSWVLVKLIELNAFIEYSKFPGYLNLSDIEYLEKYAYKKFELLKLIELFNALKDKQKNLKEEYNKTRINANESSKMCTKTNVTIDTEYISRDINNNTNNVSKINNTDGNVKGMIVKKKKQSSMGISKKFADVIEKTAAKYENIMNVCLNEKKEDKYIAMICSQLREKIIKHSTRGIDDDEKKEDDNLDELYFLPGSEAQFFNENKKYRNYFDDILYLSNRIDILTQEISDMKKEQLELYKKKSEENKNSNSVLEETIYSALFGNGILV